jgi:hypothetical protein
MFEFENGQGVDCTNAIVDICKYISESGIIVSDFKMYKNFTRNYLLDLHYFSPLFVSAFMKSKHTSGRYK